MLDGTPLFDIRPYVPRFDGGREGGRVGWLKERLQADTIHAADERFYSPPGPNDEAERGA